MDNTKFVTDLNKILDILTFQLIKFLNSTLPQIQPNWWKALVIGSLSINQKQNLNLNNEDLNDLDLLALLYIFKKQFSTINFKGKIGIQSGEGQQIIESLITIRNKLAHIKSNELRNINLDDQRDFIYKLNKFAELINSDKEVVERILELKKDINKEQTSSTTSDKAKDNTCDEEIPPSMNSEAKKEKTDGMGDNNKYKKNEVSSSETSSNRIKLGLLKDKNNKKVLVAIISILSISIITYLISNPPPVEKKYGTFITVNFDKLLNSKSYFNNLKKEEFDFGQIVVIRDYEDYQKFSFPKSSLDSISNFDSNILQNSQARFNSIGYLLKTALVKLQEEKDNLKRIYLIGNLPETPLEIVKSNIKHLFLDDSDWKLLKETSELRISIFLNSDNFSNTTMALVEKIKEKGIDYEIIQ